jgi:LAO/AO transport system kinase
LPRRTARSAPRPDDALETLAGGVRAGDIAALARAITLIESTRADHRARADALLERLLGASAAPASLRIGISGAPGVGKSTLIERLGLHVIGAGHRVAVLAIDPSSKRSGGAILGDKTRMPELARHPRAFIRPSPSGGVLGGVARRTAEAVIAVEAAGFDVVIVETVGVGQSETAVADMVDLFCLMLQPGGGDELQGLKKGVVELADLLVINKADGDLQAAATRAAADYHAALGLLRPANPRWQPAVLQCSATEGTGIAELCQTMARYRDVMGASGDLAARRRAQTRARLWAEVGDALLARARAERAVAALIPGLEAEVAAGRLTPGTAARRLLDRLFATGRPD